jgi:hypothetical protein
VVVVDKVSLDHKAVAEAVRVAFWLVQPHLTSRLRIRLQLVLVVSQVPLVLQRHWLAEH